MAAFKLFGFTQQLLAFSLRLRGARHEILTANIANADTPGYRPRDIDFEAVITSLAEMQDLPVGSQEGEIALISSGSSDLQFALHKPTGSASRHGEERLDENSVSLDKQIAMLTENALSYETSLTLLSRTLAGLRYVISEGRR